MDNPLDTRFETLIDGWQAFIQQPAARVCRWTFKNDEWWLMDRLLTDENSPAARTNAFFVTLRSPCRSQADYWLMLAHELNRWLTNYVAAANLLADRPVWTPVLIHGTADAPGRFLTMLNELAQLVAPLYAGPLVLCLLPAPGTDGAAFGRFLFALLSRPLPASTRLLVRDDAESPALDSLASLLGPVMHTRFMDMKLPELVKQVTANGDPNTPADQIRAYQRELSLALAPPSPDIPRAERIAQDALRLCQEQKWPSLTASIHTALAYAYVDEKRYADATARYQQALDVSEPAYRDKDSYAGYTSAITWLGLAALYEETKDRPRTEAHYQLAANRAVAVEEPILAVNTLYTLAKLYRKWSKPLSEEAQYDRILSLAETLTPTQRVYVRLPEIGTAYYAQQSTYQQRQTTLSRLRSLLGADWQP